MSSRNIILISSFTADFLKISFPSKALNKVQGSFLVVLLAEFMNKVALCKVLFLAVRSHESQTYTFCLRCSMVYKSPTVRSNMRV